MSTLAVSPNLLLEWPRVEGLYAHVALCRSTEAAAAAGDARATSASDTLASRQARQSGAF